MNQITYQTLDAVKAAVVAGTTVYWGNPSYVVKLSKSGDYNIICGWNGHVAYMGKDYDAKDFYTIEK
jgi:hypothetical protein